MRLEAIGGAFLVAIAFLTAPLIGEGQRVEHVRRIGWLWDGSAGPPPAAWQEAFKRGLRHLGWVEGSNLLIEVRSSDQRDALGRLSAELVALKIDVIVANPAGATQAARETTDSVPIVFAGVSDPIGLGLIRSLARPGGNVTGLSYLGVELNVKRLQLLKEAFPKIARVGILVPARHPLRERMVREVEGAAQALNIRIFPAVVAHTDPPEQIDRAFETMTQQRADAVLGLQGPHFFRERRRVAELALKYQLPGMFELAGYAEAGCLMAYAPNSADIYRRAAVYVDKILKGTKPADLPVEQPTKFELVINVKTAKALGLTIPQSILLRADQIIE